MSSISVGLVKDLMASGWSQRAALGLVGISRSTWHYRTHPRCRVADPVPHRARRTAAWLSSREQDVIETKLRAGFAEGRSVYESFYDALDAGEPVASLATWYRLARARLATHRPIRRTRRHRASAMPSLLTDAPLQAWSWDITHLKGPYQRVTYQLYLALDVFSRLVVAWRVETREDDDLAREMFTTAFAEHATRPRIVHSDGGPAMTSKTLTGLFRDLGVEVSRNRPRVSNDNPFSESLFKTTKYSPTYPDYFTSIEHARAWSAGFVDWYNHRHHHSGLQGHTPSDVHHGTWTSVHTRRQHAVDRLYATHPDRYVRPPAVLTPMAQVAINHPTTDERLHTG